MSKINVIILSLTTIAILVGSAAAEAETCSQRKAKCYSINYAQGLQRCDRYFQVCMSTGVWSSRTDTVAGMTRK